MREIIEAIIKGDCCGIDALIGAGLDVNTTTESDRWNFLHQALVSVAIPPNPTSINHLIKIGVDVNAKDRCLWTPLHFAVRTKNTDVVKLLINAGADVNAVNDEGISPFHQSLLRIPYNLEIVELLLSAGADPDIDLGKGSARRFANVVSNPDSDAVLELLSKYT